MSDPSSAPPPPDVKTCPQCGRGYGTSDRFCTVDGASLIASGSSSIIGTVVADRFLVHEKLGEGGMGEVFLAEHVRIKRKVALKLMRPWMIGDPVAVNRFHREAENASQISHVNVAQVYDFGETSDGTVYLAMEYVPGEPLSAILDREGHLHAVRAAELVRQVAEALVAAHALGILHRDLKPDNVMVGRSRNGTDVVKLVDFGIARAMNRSTQQFTSTGVVVGTPDYMSPEQLSGDTLDGRSDLYALALIAFRTLTGTSAFPEGGSGEALVARLTNPPKKLGAARPGVDWPDELQQAFTRALAADPVDRYADPMEFVAELDAAVSHMPLGEVEQEYLVALAQRSTTPVRGGPALEASTPPRSTTPVPRAASTAVETPPERPSADPSERVTMPMEAPRPTSHPWSGEIVPVTPLETAAHATAPRADDLPSAVPSASRRRPRRAMLLVAGAGLAVVATVLVRNRDRGEASAPPTIEQPANAPLVPPPEANADTVGATAAASADSSDSLIVARAQRATIAIWANGRRGSGVLIEPSGLVLTSAALVRDAGQIDAFLDPATLVRGTLLAVDSTSGVAAVMVAASRCRRCVAIEPDSALEAVVGDSLLGAPSSGRADGAVVRAVVQTVTKGVPTLTTSVSRLGEGTPFFSPTTGRVVALTLRPNGTRASLASLSDLRDVRVRARARARQVTVNDTLYPTWPAQAVPESFLNQEAPRSGANLAAYTTPAREGLVVFAMTPPVMRWRQQQMPAATPSTPDDPFKIPAKAAPAPSAARDPIGQWNGWRPTLSERRAVVVLTVSPENATFPNLPVRVVDLKGSSVSGLTLLRDGIPVLPIDLGQTDAVGNADDYRAQRRTVLTAALASFAPSEFGNRGSSYQVVARDARGRQVTLPLPASMIEAIVTDFRWMERR